MSTTVIEQTTTAEVTNRATPIVVHRPRRDTDAVLAEIDYVLAEGVMGRAS